MAMATALLIIDMQNFFGEMVDPPLANIKMLNKFFDEARWPVVYTQHGHTKEELVPPINNQLIRKVGVENALMYGSKGWELIPEIWKIAKDAPVVSKNTYDAFRGTNLHDVLKKRGVERLVICGVMTDVCCDTTARSAFCRGYETWVVSDACWTDTKEQHERALKGIELVIGRVYTTAETTAMLSEETYFALNSGSRPHR